jgi:hypothetical protein
VEFGTAEIALIVSMAVAAWQLIQHLLVGGRVRIQMRPAVLTSWATLMKGPRSGWRTGIDGELGPRGRYNVELADVTIENLGRTAVTVSDFSLDFGRLHWWSWHRHTLGGRPVAFDDGATTTARSVRLEPFDERTVLFDVWQLVEAARSRGPGMSIRARASVRVAGKRRRRRSPWRQSWWIPVGRQSLLPDYTPTSFEVIYRVAWRHLRSDSESDIDASVVAMMVEPLFDDGQRPSRDLLRDTVGEALKSRQPFMPANMIAFDLLKATEGLAPDGPSMKATRGASPN